MYWIFLRLAPFYGTGPSDQRQHTLDYVPKRVALGLASKVMVPRTRGRSNKAQVQKRHPWYQESGPKRQSIPEVL